MDNQPYGILAVTSGTQFSNLKSIFRKEFHTESTFRAVFVFFPKQTLRRFLGDLSRHRFGQ